MYTAPIGPGQKVRCVCGNRFHLTEADFIDDSGNAAGSTGGVQASKSEGRHSPPKDLLPPGTMLGRCRIIRFLGAGSYGTVYLGRHVVLDVPVAVKVLNRRAAGTAEFRKRFVREARTAAELDHPNIVKVFDAGEQDGRLYQVFEYVEGGTAADLLAAQGRLAWSQAVRIARDVARALVEAEKRNIVHRDIKPQNIMITADGETKLADLGLARHVADSSRTAGITQTTRGLGTPYYMPPEQIQDARNVDSRADIYALGATLFHLLTGEPPFTGRNSLEVLKRHMDEPAPSILERCPDLPRGIDAIVRRCLEKDPEDRYQSVGELLHDLEIVLRTPHVPVRQLIAGRPRRKRRRDRLAGVRIEWLVLLGLLILVLLPFAWQFPEGAPGSHMKNGDRPTRRKSAASPGIEREILQLRKEFGRPRTGLLRQAEIWSRLASLELRAGRTGNAIACFTHFTEVLRQIPPRHRKSFLPGFIHSVSVLLAGRRVPGEELRERMSMIRGLARGLFTLRDLMLPQNTLETLTREGGVHAGVRPEPDFWAALTYTYGKPDEIIDFLQPQAPAVQPRQEGNESREQGTHRSRPSRFVWRFPLPSLFRVTVDVFVPVGNVHSVFRCGLFTDAVWLYPPEAPCPLDLEVRTDEGRVAAVVRSQGGGVRTLDAPALRRGMPVRVQIAGALPDVTVRVNRKLLYSGRPLGDPVENTHLPASLGVTVTGPVRLQNLRLHLPAEELVVFQEGPRFFSARPFGYGIERIDRFCMAEYAAPPCMRPPKPSPVPDPDLYRALLGVDGMTVPVPPVPEETEAATPSWLVLRTPIMSAILSPAKMTWYVVAVPETEANPDVPPADDAHHVLELWNESDRAWHALKQSGAASIVASGRREVVMSFSPPEGVTPAWLTPTGEYVVRLPLTADGPRVDMIVFSLAARPRRIMRAQDSPDGSSP